MRSANLFKDYPDILTVSDVAEIMRVGKKTVYTLMRTGKLRYAKVGKKHVSSKAWVKDYLNDAIMLH